MGILSKAPALLLALAPSIAMGGAAAPFARDDVEGWLDGFIGYAITHHDIAGAMVAVIKDGNVFLMKGYGFADLERRVPMDPERTLVRFGSIGKLVTWTAVMQLVERGQLGLDRDVTEYLDFQIPATFEKPITMRHLMTHTAGFEDCNKWLLHTTPDTVPSLQRYVKERLPRRIFPPGAVPAYSNYGTALAGYVVERIAQVPFEDYVTRHIFEPLGMGRSTFREPLTGALADALAQEYQVASEPPLPHKLAGPRPAGSLSASVADMTQFMRAHLSRSGSPILKADTAGLMHGTALRALPPLNGMTLGFFESDRNGRRVISHGGDIKGFHSEMYLLPGEQAGLLFVQNSAGTGEASYAMRHALMQQFIDRYFPAQQAADPGRDSPEQTQDLQRAGPYEFSLRCDSGFGSLLMVLGQMELKVEKDGALVVPAALAPSGEPRRWRGAGPYVWREAASRLRLAAQVRDGRVNIVGFEPFSSVLVFQPAPGWRSSSWNVPLLLATVLILIGSVVIWPVDALVRTRFGAALDQRVALANHGTRFAALLNLLFLLGWTLIITADDTKLSVQDGRLDPWIRTMHGVGVLAIASTVGAACANVRAWRHSSWIRKIDTAVTTLAGLSVAWFALAFNLITTHLDY